MRGFSPVQQGYYNRVICELQRCYSSFRLWSSEVVTFHVAVAKFLLVRENQVRWWIADHRVIEFEQVVSVICNYVGFRKQPQAPCGCQHRQ